ncbi:MAG: thiamine-phosphate kinase [Halobacteriales archaeon]|nr:thiamine-phosphate kinase [Halobacteriales archaeon]
MQAGEVGERALVRRLARHFVSKRNALGLMDDAAALRFGDAWLVASVDRFARATHFPPGMGHEDMGWHACAAALSDLAAKGAEPLGVLVALGVPGEMDEEPLDAVARGLAACAEAHGCEVLGGDTKPGADLSLAVTALGRAPEDELLPRTGARPGDVLAVTGDLGGAAGGLAALRRGDASLAERVFRPRARFAEGRAIAASRGARACTDLSDGLGSSLHQLADGIGFVVRSEALPVSPLAAKAAGHGAEARRWALQGGGDYELLCVLQPSAAERVGLAVRAAGGRLTPIGHAVAERGVWLEQRGQRSELPDEGWEHFRSPQA